MGLAETCLRQGCQSHALAKPASLPVANQSLWHDCQCWVSAGPNPRMYSFRGKPRSCQHRNLSDLLVGQKKGNENIPQSTLVWNHRWPLTRMKGLWPQDNSRSVEFACHFKSFYIYFVYIYIYIFMCPVSFSVEFQQFSDLEGSTMAATSMLRPLTMLSFRLVRGSTLLKKG